jgi:hypothetical protein
MGYVKIAIIVFNFKNQLRKYGESESKIQKIGIIIPHKTCVTQDAPHKLSHSRVKAPNNFQ